MSEKKRINLYLSKNTRAHLDKVAREREIYATSGRRTGEPNMSKTVAVLAAEAANEASTEQS